MNKQEKKRVYNERIIQIIDHDASAPLLLSVNGRVGRENQECYSLLTQLISEKRPCAVNF